MEQLQMDRSRTRPAQQCRMRCRGSSKAAYPTASPSAALAFGAVHAVAVHRIAQRATRAFLADEPEARLARRPLDDEAHGDALHAAGGIESHQADVMLR